MSAIQNWENQVQAHHVQSIRAQQETGDSEDMWRPLAPRFRDDPNRVGDPVLDKLYPWVTSDTTVLDVGGGAGRYALPLALRAHHVTVVEPSPSMVENLREGAEEANITNLSIDQATWEESKADPSDLVLCAHVLYGTTEIEAFVRKLDQRAKERVVILIYMESPQAQLGPFWQRVHGEKRIDLPALPELLPVLWQVGIYPDVEMFEVIGPRTAPNRKEAQAMLGQFLYVSPVTNKDQRLEAAMGELLVETPEGLVIRGAQPRRQALVSWSPGNGPRDQSQQYHAV